MKSLDDPIQQNNILIVEDDIRLGTFTRMALEAEGYKVALVSQGKEAIQHLKNYATDLIILDLELPDTHGITLCREIETFFHVPVIIFSAEARIKTKIEALDVGARDYMVKPVDVRELKARVRTQLKLSQKHYRKRFFPQGNLHYNVQSEKFFVNEKPLKLSETPRLILKQLTQNPEHLFTKAALFNSVWGSEYNALRDSHVVEVQISRLRKVFKKFGCTCRIRSSYGKGYYLVADVEAKDI